VRLFVAHGRLAAAALRLPVTEMTTAATMPAPARTAVKPKRLRLLDQFMPASFSPSLETRETGAFAPISQGATPDCLSFRYRCSSLLEGVGRNEIRQCSRPRRRVAGCAGWSAADLGQRQKRCRQLELAGLHRFEGEDPNRRTSRRSPSKTTDAGLITSKINISNRPT